MSIDLMFQQANAAYRAGDFAGAERRYRALTRLKPAWVPWHRLGALYVATRSGSREAGGRHSERKAWPPTPPTPIPATRSACS